MNDDDLRNILAVHALPAATEEVRARALHRALVALRHRPQPSAQRNNFPRLAWIFGASVAAALLLLATVLWRGADDSGALLTEMESLFGGRLAGVVIGVEVEVLMADGDTPRPTDQRVEVEIDLGSSRLRVLTYSGNRVCLPLDGRSVCLTALIAGDDHVFVVPEGGTLPARTHITARRIRG